MSIVSWRSLSFWIMIILPHFYGRPCSDSTIRVALSKERANRKKGNKCIFMIMVESCVHLLCIILYSSGELHFHNKARRGSFVKLNLRLSCLVFAFRPWNVWPFSYFKIAALSSFGEKSLSWFQLKLIGSAAGKKLRRTLHGYYGQIKWNAFFLQACFAAFLSEQHHKNFFSAASLHWNIWALAKEICPQHFVPVMSVMV